jgi:hypothetical protein
MYKRKEFRELIEILKQHNQACRSSIQKQIIKIYGITDSHSVNAKINMLLAYGIIDHSSDFKKPKPSTVYYINQDTISKVLSQL